MDRAIVIGGGIAGVAAAAELAPHVAVTLLEAEDSIGYHASARSAAMFLEAYGNATVRSLNHASSPLHRSAEVLSPRGFLLLASETERAAFEADCAEMEAAPIDVREALAAVPILNADHVAYVARLGNVFDIDTDRLLQGYAKAARGAGARIVTRAPAEAIEASGGVWRVTAGDRVHEAEILVNAAGAWADRIAALAGATPIGLTPNRRSMARLPAPGGHDTSRWPMLLGAAESWYAKPDAGAWLVSPADEDPTEPHDAWADDMVIAEGIARYQPFVTEEVTRVETTWAGLRTFAPDRTPVIGEDPERPGFWWLAGQGGYGFQIAPAAAELLADLVTGKQPRIGVKTATELSPSRFRP